MKANTQRTQAAAPKDQGGEGGALQANTCPPAHLAWGPAIAIACAGVVRWPQPRAQALRHAQALSSSMFLGCWLQVHHVG